MSVDFEQLTGLWTRPLPEGSAALEAFSRLYAKRVKVNGTEIPLEALVERARGMHSVFAEMSSTLLSKVDTPTHTAIVFRMRGKHVGPLPTPMGVLPPTGKVTERQVIDLLTVKEGRIVEVWMCSDELGALAGIGALQLASQ
jgi:predicted ester cyclase